MNLLFRYVFARQARLLLLIMGLGLGLYLLTELVERADIFMDAGADVLLVAKYFAARLPGIVAQILPAVFLLATVVTLCLMHKSREITALHAGGIPFSSLTAIFVACGIFWGAAQFACAQFLGVEGAAVADRIWQEQVRKKNMSRRTLENIWFNEDGWTVSVKKLRADGAGQGFSAFHIPEGSHDIDIFVNAAEVQADSAGWTAINGEALDPQTYVREQFKEKGLSIHQEPGIFFAVGKTSIQQLPLWRLGETIEKLDSAGSNVEGFRTIWHGKISYACSLVVMALLGAAIITLTWNIYLAVFMSLGGTFFLYALIMFGESLGQRGVLPPMAAAWGPLLLPAAAALGRLAVWQRGK